MEVQSPLTISEGLQWQLMLLATIFILVVHRVCDYHVKKHAEYQIDFIPFSIRAILLEPWLEAFKFVTNSSEMIAESIRKYGLDGNTFKISTPARWIVVATDSTVLKEIRNADERVLSIQAAAKERLSTAYTLSSTIHENPYHVGIIKKNLTQQILKGLPDIVEELDKVFMDGPKLGKEWTQIDAHHLMLECITAITTRSLVGEALANDQEYLEILSALSTAFSSAGLIIDLAPCFLKTILAFWLIPRGPLKVFLTKLGPLFEERRRNMQKFGDDWLEKPNDVIQWILEAAPPDSSLYELCIRILYISVSAIHTSAITITNALYDLAASPEFQKPIREEIERVLEECGGWKKEALAKMKNLDSSLKETLRLYPVTTATVMRKALQHHVLADGTHLHKNQWVVAPAWELNRSAHIYQNPNEFDALRFSSMTSKPSIKPGHQMSITGDGYFSFGAGKHACPGRVFTTAELKVVLAYILCNYNFKFAHQERNRPKNKFYMFSCFPDPNVRMMFKVRDEVYES